jgi:Fe-S-cluster containining protein
MNVSADEKPGRRASPTERRLHELWMGPVRKAMLRLRSVLRNLRLARRYRLRPLRLEDLEMRVPDGMVPDCASCQDTCCRGPQNTISLRLEDVARLVDAELEWAITTEKPTYSDEMRERYASLRTIERLDTYRFFPVLKRKPDGTCIFLDDAGRCSIHELRPLRCRRFPYRLDDALTGIDYSPACRFPRHDGTPGQTRELAQAAVDTYNAKIRDLVMLEYGRDALERLDLMRYLTPDGERT